jgi:hypothetical protein
MAGTASMESDAEYRTLSPCISGSGKTHGVFFGKLEHIASPG